MSASPSAPLPALPGASSVLSQQVFQDRHIQHAVRQQLFQPGVLCLKCLQPAGVRDIHASELRLPFNGMDGSPSTTEAKASQTKGDQK